MNSMLSQRNALLGFAAAEATLSGAAAFAQTPANDYAPSITVRYADLDLASPVAVQVLYRRVETAAKAVCNHGESRELARQVAAERCVDNAVNNAIHKIDVPQLNALYRAKMNSRGKVG